jgi:N-acetylglutamate synthase-like GNAT family acetyltransferase
LLFGRYALRRFGKRNAMAIEFREATADDIDNLREFLSEQGWAERVRDRSRLQAMLERADRSVLALDDGAIVGFGRALCDGVSNGYISMVAVAGGRRRQGIGRGVVERLIGGDADGQITWVLRAGRGSRGFWTRLGFAPSSIAMERVRTR